MCMNDFLCEESIHSGNHCFRSTYATKLGKKLGSRTAQASLGHQNIKTTERYMKPQIVTAEAAASLYEGD